MGDSTFIVACRGVHKELFQTLPKFVQAYREGWRAVDDSYNKQAQAKINEEDAACNQMSLFK